MEERAVELWWQARGAQRSAVSITVAAATRNQQRLVRHHLNPSGPAAASQQIRWTWRRARLSGRQSDRQQQSVVTDTATSDRSACSE